MRIPAMKRLPLFALMLVMGALLFSFPAYATNAPAPENPVQTEEPVPDQTPGPDGPPPEAPAPGQSESAVPVTAFTPDGTGTVIDHVTDDNGKEFYTIKAEDGAVFYLVIDRQRNSENVYFLNAVTEDDLMSLAKPGNGKSESAVPAPPSKETPSPEPSPEPSPTPSSGAGGMGNGSVIFIIIAVVVVGGAAYYFKVHRPKHQAPPEDDDYDDDAAGTGDDEEIEYEEGEDEE